MKKRLIYIETDKQKILLKNIFESGKSILKTYKEIKFIIKRLKDDEKFKYKKIKLNLIYKAIIDGKLVLIFIKAVKLILFLFKLLKE